MTDKFPRLYALSQQEIDVYLDMDQDLRDLFSQRDSLRDDLKAAQAIIVDAGQQVADLKAENERLREALEPFAALADFNGWNTSAASGANAVVYANDKGVLTRGNFEYAREALQPKGDKQS